MVPSTGPLANGHVTLLSLEVRELEGSPGKAPGQRGPRQSM